MPARFDPFTVLNVALILLLAAMLPSPALASDGAGASPAAVPKVYMHAWPLDPTNRVTKRAPTAEQIAAVQAAGERNLALGTVDRHVKTVRISLGDLSNRSARLETSGLALQARRGTADGAIDRVAACSSELIAAVGALNPKLQALISTGERDEQLQRAIANLASSPRAHAKKRLLEHQENLKTRDIQQADIANQLNAISTLAKRCSDSYNAVNQEFQQRQAQARRARDDIEQWNKTFLWVSRDLNQLIAKTDEARRSTWPTLRSDQMPAHLQAWPPHASLEAAHADLQRHQDAAYQALETLLSLSVPANTNWPDLQQAYARGLPLLNDLLQAQAGLHYLQAAAPHSEPRCRSEACQAWRKERSFVAAEFAKRQTAWDAWQTALLTAGKTATAPSHAAIAVLNDESQLWQQVDQAFAHLQAASGQITQSVNADMDRFEILLRQEMVQARTAYERAYFEAFGDTPLDDMAPGAGHPMPPAFSARMPAPASASFFRPVEDHSHQRITRLDQEYPNFGTYTYVLIRAQDDWTNRPAVRERVVRLLSYLASATPEGDGIAQDLRPRFNLFVLPSDAKKNYNSLLGHEIKARIRSGLMLQPAIRDALLKQPGPFLLTLPTTVKTMQTDSAVVFADLSKVPLQTVHDVARQYMKGLVASLPKDQKQWKPPAKLGFAMALISLADDASGFAFHLFPGGEAMAKGR